MSPQIPLDILLLIGAAADTRVLLSMLLTSKSSNRMLTPILYSALELDSWDVILKFVDALIPRPEGFALKRDPARYVRALVLRQPLARRPFYASQEAIANHISHILLRMHHLQRFSSEIGLRPHSSDILYTLTTGPFARLQSITLNISDETPSALEESDLQDVVQFYPQVSSSLCRLKLEVPEYSKSAQKCFLRNLLSSCATSLRALSLSTDSHPHAEIWDMILPSDCDFPKLVDLEIESQAIHRFSSQQVAHVRSLKILNQYAAGFNIDSAAFPALRSISCSSKMIPAFLPAATRFRRHIDTIHLDHILHERPRPGTWNVCDRPTWGELAALLEHLDYSAVPVRNLSFQVEKIPITGFTTLRTHLETVESLVMILHAKYTFSWLYLFAAETLAHLPRLHTLLVSGIPSKARTDQPRELTLTQALDLSRKLLPFFEDQRPTLRRVAFTMDVEWLKRDDGWHWIGDPRYAEKGRFEEDKEQHDDDDQGSVSGFGSEDNDVDEGQRGESGYASEGSVEDTRFLPTGTTFRGSQSEPLEDDRSESEESTVQREYVGPEQEPEEDYSEYSE